MAADVGAHRRRAGIQCDVIVGHEHIDLDAGLAVPEDHQGVWMLRKTHGAVERPHRNTAFLGVDQDADVLGGSGDAMSVKSQRSGKNRSHVVLAEVLQEALKRQPVSPWLRSWREPLEEIGLVECRLRPRQLKPERRPGGW